MIETLLELELLIQYYILINNYLYTDSGTPFSISIFGSGGFTFEMWVYINKCDGWII